MIAHDPSIDPDEGCRLTLTFRPTADLTFAVAGELYGSGSAEQQAVQGGWEGAGIAVNPTFAKKLARPAKTTA
jgi:hypothetical protein